MVYNFNVLKTLDNLLKQHESIGVSKEKVQSNARKYTYHFDLYNFFRSFLPQEM